MSYECSEYMFLQKSQQKLREALGTRMVSNIYEIWCFPRLYYMKYLTDFKQDGAKML